MQTIAFIVLTIALFLFILHLIPFLEVLGLQKWGV